MAIGFAVATAFTLLAVLVGFAYYTTLTRREDEPGMVRQLCAALYPNFTWPHTGRDTTQTFHLLLSGMMVFGLVLAAWSTGAGAMRAVWLLSTDTVKSTWLEAAKCSAAGCQWETWLFTLLQIVRAIGGVLLICLAGGLIGGFFGFLFGIPRRISADSGAADSKAAADKRAADYALGTNLTKVSDWLTSAIIGVTLVEAKNGYDGFVTASTTAAGWLFESRHGSPAVLAAAIAGGTVFGFLFFYLYTQLVLSRLIATAERALGAMPVATKRLQDIAPATARYLVPPIRRTAHPIDKPEEPSDSVREAVMAYYTVTLNDLINSADVNDEEIQSWARSRAVLNNYRDAAQAYLYLLGRKRR